MKRRKSPPDTFMGWIALSSAGLPAYVLGYAPTRTILRERYREKYFMDMEDAGYTVVKVTITKAKK